MGTPATEPVPFRSRLCYTLVESVLGAMERELTEVKAVRFLCDYPWIPGKRLRPIVFLLSNFSVRVARSPRIEANGREARLAAAIELLHEASLVHDDLVDRSDVRRGVPSMQMMNGEGLALLIGDYMVFRGLKLVLDAAETREDILLAQELANTGLLIAHGEADQLDRFLKKQSLEERVSLDSYVDLIAKKTAAFFAGCAEAGAALGGADKPLRKVYREFGLNLGIAFQMMDDLMDIFGDADVAHKTLRNNLSEGTVTLPMIHAWELFPRNRTLGRFVRGESLEPRAQTTLYGKMADPKVLERSEETVRRYTTLAEDYLGQMPVSIYRTGLADLLDYVKACSWGGLDRTGGSGRRKSDG